MMGAYMRLLWYLKQEFKVMGDDVVNSPSDFLVFRSAYSSEYFIT